MNFFNEMPVYKSKINKVTSLCIKRDITTWEVCSKNIIKLIAAENYEVIVPDCDVELFRRATHPKIAVVPETSYVDNETINRLSEIAPAARHGWYLQQLLKIAALKAGEGHDVNVIWDADTLPLRKMTFLDRDGCLIYRIGYEHHAPYFDQMLSMMGITKSLNASFIAQCFPAKSFWVNTFCQDLEQRSGKNWQISIIEKINFEELSGFSEYEALGNYFLSKYPNEMKFSTAPWERLGKSKFGQAEAVYKNYRLILPLLIEFISFESFDVARIEKISPKEFLVYIFKEILKENTIISYPQINHAVRDNGGLNTAPVKRLLR